MSEPSPGTPAGEPQSKHNIGELLASLIEQEKACNVEQIQVVEQPAPLRTKDHLYRGELERIHEAKNIPELMNRISEAHGKWGKLGMFKNVDFFLGESTQGDPEGVNVQVLLAERGRFSGKAGTYVQGSEGSVEAQVGVHNYTGHAEQLTARAEYGSQHSSTYSVAYQQPYLAGIPAIAELKLQKYFRNQQEFSSYTQHLTSVGASLSSMGGHHQVGCELGWRRLLDPSATASRSVLQHAGEYLLSTMQYTYQVDERDSPAMTRSGWAFKSQSSVSGLFPGAKPAQLKQQLDWMWASPMGDSASFIFSGTLGVLFPWGSSPTTRPTCICDRFFLGGPSTLRGFAPAGAGPTDIRRPPPRQPDSSASSSTPPAPGRDALGGDLYTSLMASIVFDLPSTALRALNIHGQAFINGGNVVALTGRPGSGGGLSGGLQEFSSTFRWAAGLGLVFPTWFGRLEANLVRVLAQQEHDKARHGLQLGFSTSAFV